MLATRKMLVLLWASGLLMGCASIRGTFVDPPKDGNRVYAGTRLDLKDIALDCECDPIGAVAHLILWPVFVVDLPLSMVTDTLFLPYTLASSRQTGK